MPKTITDRIPFLRPSSRKIAVASVANAAYDQGWKDREALCLTEHAAAGKAAAA